MMVFRGAFRPRKPGPKHDLKKALPDGVRKAINKRKAHTPAVTLPKLKCLEQQPNNTEA
ncbi:hypothetical protein PQI07_22610 [Methylobacterium sp. 092160098-2]|uniref:hypothetical protein n=1 Tax=Methylobacterium sp. 092160098-2 TaxID=3025129 RepID=UPI0023819404|nr:hypothetical protein [Methylobacterium sp. 092160098-2]MDE4913476.1 hypothetical protein [Methylobacterium sp. 092160098-2]